MRYSWVPTTPKSRRDHAEKSSAGKTAQNSSSEDCNPQDSDPQNRSSEDRNPQDSDAQNGSSEDRNPQDTEAGERSPEDCSPQDSSAENRSSEDSGAQNTRGAEAQNARNQHAGTVYGAKADDLGGSAAAGAGTADRGGS